MKLDQLKQQKFDPLDEKLLGMLRADARATNRDMAKALGISEITVAARIRSLTDRKLMRVTAQQDIWTLGFDLVVLADIFVSGRPAEQVADELARIDQVGSVSITLSSPELIIQMVARDRSDLARLLREDIAAVAGVTHVETLIVLDIYRFRSDMGVLDTDDSA